MPSDRNKSAPPYAAKPQHFVVLQPRIGQRKRYQFGNEENARSFYVRLTLSDWVSYVELIRLTGSHVETLASHFGGDEGGAA